MKERLFTCGRLLVLGPNFLFYLVYFQLMLWTTTYALAVFVSPAPHVGRATATYFVLLDVGVGVGPYTLGLLEPAFGFSAVYWAGAVVALSGVLYYFSVIGRTGVFTRSAMARVRSLRLHEVELPEGKRSGK